MTNLPSIPRNPVVDKVAALIDFDTYPFNELSEKQLAYVLHIHHGPTAAARRAGYNNAPDAVRRLRTNQKVLLAIDTVRDVITHTSIAGSIEILQVWTDIVRDEALPPKDRMAAGNLLAKAHGMMTEKIIIDKHVKEEKIVVNISMDADGGNIQKLVIDEPSKLK